MPMLIAHHESPVDVIGAIEQLLSSPSRSDSLMREIANRVKPWIELTSSPPTGELLGHLPDSANSVWMTSQNCSNIIRRFQPEIVLPPCQRLKCQYSPLKWMLSQPRVRESDSGGDSYEMARVESSSSVRTHIYDAGRFGSQGHLLDLLQRAKGKHQSLQDLLGALSLDFLRRRRRCLDAIDRHCKRRFQWAVMSGQAGSKIRRIKRVVVLMSLVLRSMIYTKKRLKMNIPCGVISDLNFSYAVIMAWMICSRGCRVTPLTIFNLIKLSWGFMALNTRCWHCCRRKC